MKNKTTFLIIVIALLLAAHRNLAQVEFQSAKHHFDSGYLNLRVLYPEKFDPSKKYPVLLFLHGSGERGSDNKKQLVHGSGLFTADDYRRNHPSVVIFPQCPKRGYWSNRKVDTNTEKRLVFEHGREPTAAMAGLMSLMDSIVSLDYAKKDQIYVGGLSMGGMGTFELLARKPDMFAAAFPICGGGSPESVPEYAQKVSLWVFHGAKDTVVFPAFSRDMVIALYEAGASPKYTLYKDAGHNSWDSAFAEPGLLSWLFSQNKK